VCTRPGIGGAVHPRCQTRYSPDGLTAFFRYDGPVRKAIKLLKYRRISDLASELSNLLINVFTDKKELYVSMSRFIQNTNPHITAIPLYKTRERQRWFNQSELVAKKLSEQLDFQFSHDLLPNLKLDF
jgi:predicted amidophosphoribosyltransferase